MGALWSTLSSAANPPGIIYLQKGKHSNKKRNDNNSVGQSTLSSAANPPGIIYLQKDDPQVVVCCLEQLRGVDIIVNSTDKSLQLSSGGQLSDAIKDIGGPKVQEELNRDYPSGIKPGEVAVTDGYNLPYSYVYHCSLQNINKRVSHHLMREIISECLEKAKDQCPDPSIAFPVIGTGAMNFPARILRTIYCTILEFMEENRGSLEAAYIIIHPSRTDLRDYMKNIDRTEQLSRLRYPVTFPSSWSQTHNICRIKLGQGDHEYQWVESHFNDTIGRSIKIIQIERIENRRLFVAYERFKNNLENGTSTEKFLWHGTKQESIDSIIRYGFDWRLTTRAVWGQGCYFAAEASYSDNDQFAVPNSRNEKCMFLVNVVVGKAIVGNSGVTEKNISCQVQSTVNTDETIYVTYNDDQQYPAYVMIYKHE